MGAKHIEKETTLFMADNKIRVRFAPSPTGPLHIGGVRTALYNYLFARKQGGKMIFRIEDTDSTRFVPGAEEYIIESFKWLGIEFDEGVGIGGDKGPYRQSERREIYKQYVEQLLQNGAAYYAFDTPDELNAKRQEVANFQYDASTRTQMRNSLTLPEDEVKRLLETEPYVVRFKINAGEEVHVKDIIRGDVVVNSSVLDDKVLYKSADQLPTYHLANIVDDHLMEISHVIRGEEWLPSAPLHVLLYRAFGWQDTMPAFAHLPLLLKPDGKGKLSKRDGDKLGFPVFPLQWTDPQTGNISSGYRESGYLKEAVINFLALLGWNPGTEQEILSLDELTNQFDLAKCSKSGAKFDYMKGWWFNREYLLLRSDDELAPDFLKILEANGVHTTADKAAQVIGMMKQKVVEYVDGQSGQTRKRNISFLADLWPLCDFFFCAPQDYDRADKFIVKNWKENTAAEMQALACQLEGVESWTVEDMKAAIDPWVAESGIRPWNAWRICLVGKGQGPDMYELAAFLGKQETLERMAHAVKTLA